MNNVAALGIPKDGKLVNNIVYFARALRQSGLNASPDQILNSIEAVHVVGFQNKIDMYWALHACFVTNVEQMQVFSQMFRLFWRDPRYLEHMMSIMLPSIRGVAKEEATPSGSKRAADSLIGNRLTSNLHNDKPNGHEVEYSIDASGSASSKEKLKSMDFDQMTADEASNAQKIIASIQLPIAPLTSRRMTRHHNGNIPGWRETMRNTARTGGQVIDIKYRKHCIKWPNIVALCDVSGSMSAYSRAILHFLHALINRKRSNWARVSAFTFGTQLTNITRYLTSSDVDIALQLTGKEVEDWDGGTRIGDCLHNFNLKWSRRVIGHGSVVLLISDGLESGDPELLAKEMKRLHLSSHRVIWLNPLLRWKGFAPKARGIRAILPHVDCFRSVHNIDSLENLAIAVSHPYDAGEKRRLMAMI